MRSINREEHDTNPKPLSIEQLKERAGTAEGDIWKPRLDVDRLDPPHQGWYWRDTAESPRDQWRGLFASERAARVAALEEYGVSTTR